MPPVCPSCKIALDPAHAPIARIRGSKVVTYCSVECANDASVAVSVASVLKEPAPDVDFAEPAPKSKLALVTEAEAPEASTPEAAEPSVERARARTRGESREPSAASAESQRMSASLRKRVLFASGAIMMGGMAIAVVQSIAPSSPSAVSAEHREAGTGPTPTPAAQPKAPEAAQDSTSKDVAPSPAELRALAIAELEGQLEEGSPRYQRLAGMALARLQHAGAVKTLARLLEKENSDLSRIDIAYGLALAGDSAGRDYLVKELESKRRDVRIDASRRLVQLGDDAGRKALHQMLGVRSHRLGAASVLALLGDEKGLDVLVETYEDENSSEENRMRAAVGLGLAGNATARELLNEILKEGKYVVDAAGALARLGDESAVPALERQLELTALRVGAAESLKSMDVDVDITPLASALIKSNTEGRIAAAEAILILGQE